MKIGIIGSRRRDTKEDKLILVNKLAELDISLKLRFPFIFVSGGCPKGGDRFAEEIAKETNTQIIIHYPDKSSLPENPKKYDFARINYERNTLIAQDADILIALVASDRKGGTEDTICKYLKLGKKDLYLI